MKATAPLCGTIAIINVEEGVRISEGEEIMSIEAMKMMNMILSPCDGVIEKIYVKLGELVEEEQVVAEIKEG